MFRSVGKRTINTRTPFLRLIQPSRKTSHEQKSFIYVAPTIWNNLLGSLKTIENVNTYKHKVKKHFLRKMSNKGNNIYYCF